jgi:hypothetical protein
LAIALSVLSFFWPLHCLFFCDLQLLITHLVSSNFKLVFSVWFFFIIDVVYLLSETEVQVVVQTYWLLDLIRWLVCRFDRLTFTIPKQCNQYLNECPSISELGNHSPIWLTCLFGPFVLHTSSSFSKI